MNFFFKHQFFTFKTTEFFYNEFFLRHAFFDPEIFKTLEIPDVKCKSFRSNLYHEKKVSELVGKFLNQLELRRSLNEVRKIGYNKDIKDLPDKSGKIHKLIEDSRRKVSTQQKFLENTKNIQEDNMNIESISKKNAISSQKKNEIIASNLSKWPGIYIYLVQNRASISLILNKMSLHKHGFRKYISWGPIKESLIAGCLHELNFIENCRKFLYFS